MPILWKHSLFVFIILRIFDELFDVMNDDLFLTLKKTTANLLIFLYQIKITWYSVDSFHGDHTFNFNTLNSFFHKFGYGSIGFSIQFFQTATKDLSVSNHTIFN